MKLSEFLKQQRISLNMTPDAIAERLGYRTGQVVYDWEEEVTRPPIELIRTLAIIYEVPAEDIFSLMRDEIIENAKVEMREAFSKRSPFIK